jgi:hypothetical protein
MRAVGSHCGTQKAAWTGRRFRPTQTVRAGSRAASKEPGVIPLMLCSLGQLPLWFHIYKDFLDFVLSYCLAALSCYDTNAAAHALASRASGEAVVLSGICSGRPTAHRRQGTGDTRARAGAGAAQQRH